MPWTLSNTVKHRWNRYGRGSWKSWKSAWIFPPKIVATLTGIVTWNDATINSFQFWIHWLCQTNPWLHFSILSLVHHVGCHCQHDSCLFLPGHLKRSLAAHDNLLQVSYNVLVPPLSSWLISVLCCHIPNNRLLFGIRFTKYDLSYDLSQDYH